MMTNLIVAQIANIMNSQQFLNLTIDQYLWGYDDNLVTLAHNALPNWINFPRFGIFDRVSKTSPKTLNLRLCNLTMQLF